MHETFFRFNKCSAWLGAVCTGATRRDRWSASLVVLGVLSAMGVLAVRFAINPEFPFPRYAYPVLWVGLAAAAVACARAKSTWIPAAVLLLQLPLVTGLWPGVLPTVRYWPDAVTTEAYANGGTILSGTPSYGWIAASPRALRDLCVYLPRASAPGANEAILWFSNISRHAGFYDETHVEEFERCSAARVVVDRRFSIDSCDTEWQPFALPDPLVPDPARQVLFAAARPTKLARLPALRATILSGCIGAAVRNPTPERLPVERRSR